MYPWSIIDSRLYALDPRICPYLFLRRLKMGQVCVLNSYTQMRQDSSAFIGVQVCDKVLTILIRGGGVVEGDPCTEVRYTSVYPRGLVVLAPIYHNAILACERAPGANIYATTYIHRSTPNRHTNTCLEYRTY